VTRHRTALGTVLLGFAMAVAAQALIPAGRLPLYDGVVVQEPYRYLSPREGQAGSPTSYRATLPVEEGRSPVLGAATEEVPPQAQLIAAPGAFVVPAGAAAVIVTIEPIPPPGPGDVQGNVYRIQVTDEAGAVLVPASGAVPKVVLRAPGDLLRARIGRFAGGAWQDLQTSHGGQPGIYLATPTALGDFAVLGTPVTPPDAGLDLRLVVIGLLVALGSAGLLLFAFFRPRRRVAPVEPLPQRTRVPPKRRKRRR
jgi:hypothetical protein